MIIHSVTIENFRSFYGKHKICFSIDEKKNTTFVWGDNNVGKTNLLNSITWCLHEQFTSSFKRKDDLLNHQAKLEGINKFSVTIDFEESGVSYSLKRIGGLKPSVYLHRIVDGNHTSINGVSRFINSIIPKDMMMYFVIDGEGVSNEVDSKGQINTKRSIKDILGFGVAEKALDDLRIIKKEYERELGKIDVSSDLSKSQNRLTKIEDDIARLKKDLVDLNEGLSLLTAKKDEAEDYLKASDHSLVKIKIRRRDELRKDIFSLNETLRILQESKVNAIRKNSYYAFMSNINLDSIDLVLPEKKNNYSALTGSLVQQILKESECICGASVNDDSIRLKLESLLENSSNHEVEHRLHKVKSILQSTTGSAENPIEEICKILHRVQMTQDDIIHKEGELENISLEIKNVDNEKIANYERSLRKVLDQIDSTNRQIGAKENSLQDKLSEKEKLDLEVKRLSALTPETSKIRRKISFINELQKVIESELESAFDNIRLELVRRMNNFLHAHLAQNLIVKMSSDDKVGLYNRDSTLTAPGGGVTAMLSLVFVSTLINLARVRRNARGNILTPGAIAPIILDAPFSKLSETYAPKLAAALPELSEQLIIFMYEGNAKGGEKVMREKGYVGKEYYLLQKLKGAQKSNQLVSYLTIGNERYKTVEYGQPVDTVSIEEVAGYA